MINHALIYFCAIASAFIPFLLAKCFIKNGYDEVPAYGFAAAFQIFLGISFICHAQFFSNGLEQSVSFGGALLYFASGYTVMQWYKPRKGPFADIIVILIFLITGLVLVPLLFSNQNIVFNSIGVYIGVLVGVLTYFLKSKLNFYKYSSR